MKYVDIKVAESSNGKNIIQSTIKKALTFVRAFSDLDRIQTCNLLSRNQMRYSVAPRGLIVITGAKVQLFFDFASVFSIFLHFIYNQIDILIFALFLTIKIF